MNNSADFIARKIYFHWLLRSKVANDVGRQNSLLSRLMEQKIVKFLLLMLRVLINFTAFKCSPIIRSGDIALHGLSTQK